MGAGRLRPAQEHLVSAIVRSVLGGLLRAAMRPNASPKIVFATPTASPEDTFAFFSYAHRKRLRDT